jgi:hypothetical protein
MDDSRFDTMTRLLAPASRRQTLLALASILGVTLVPAAPPLGPSTLEACPPPVSEQGRQPAGARNLLLRLALRSGPDALFVPRQSRLRLLQRCERPRLLWPNNWERLLRK